MSYTVYMHMTPNNKIYFGITSQKPQRRWSNGRGYINNKHFYRAIQKYGWNNIKHLILFTGLNKKQAKKYEVLLIYLYNTTNPKLGYNITKGGDSVNPRTAETIAKIKVSLTGKKRTYIQKRHYSKAAFTRNRVYIMSKEHKERIRKSLIGNKRAVGNVSNCKLILQIDIKTFKVIGEYRGAVEASKMLYIDNSGISRACRENMHIQNIEETKYKGKYGGYIWCYA